MNSPHYLVTGGAGFIGSHLVESLLQNGARVTVVDDLSSGNAANLPPHAALTFINRDLAQLQSEDVADAPIAIAHLAAIPSVVCSWQHPMAAHQANLTNTLKVIELAKRWNCPRIVFASSAAVYGNVQKMPVREDQPTLPISPYGLQKLTSENYLDLFAQQSGLQAIALRLFNVFGPRQNPDSEYSGVISIFANAIKSGREIFIYGDGEQTRDFIYVKDIVQAFHLALTQPVHENQLLRCNVGLGQATSINVLVASLARACTNAPARITHLPSRAGDVRHSCADVTRIRARGFTPAFSVDVGLARLLATY